MLKHEDAIIAVVDVQDKLVRVMHEPERLVNNARKMIRGAKVLGAPIIWTEQYPRGLGPTVGQIASLLGGEPITKMTFSCWGVEQFRHALDDAGRGQVLLVGIEAHVCVYQTALDLLAEGLEVYVVADAVSSRTSDNCRIALEQMRQCGAVITSVEGALFELLGSAESEAFKAILEIVK